MDSAALQGTSIAGKYQIERLIGQGGMAEVYLASWNTAGETKRVAIKVLSMQSSNPATTQRFLREAEVLRGLDHPHIVRFYDSGILPSGQPYIVMEFLVGRELGGYSADDTSLSEAQAVSIAAQTALALHYAHARGVIHRDVKPSNIFVESNSEQPEQVSVKVLDFGIAKLTRPPQEETRNPALTQQGQLLGTPVFMAPEQMIDEQAVDERSDLYALGAVLFEMLTGQPPFAGVEIALLLHRKVSQRVGPSPREINPAISASVAAIVVKLLSLEKADRYQSAAELYEALRLTPAGKGLAAIDAVPVTPSLPRSSSGESGRAADPWEALARSLPPTTAKALPQLRQLFLGVFASCSFVAANVLGLHGPSIPDAASFEFYAVFMGDSIGAESQGRLGTKTFLGYSLPLELHLAKLRSPERKVIVAIFDSIELGRGVRQKILEYRNQFQALVIPLYLGEILKASREQQFRALLLDRLADLHTVPDLFANLQRSDDPTRYFGMNEAVNELVRVVTRGRGLCAVYGLPGAGKTALLLMAEYGLGTTHLRTVACELVGHRKPAQLAEEVAAALEQRPADLSKAPEPGALRGLLLRAAEKAQSAAAVSGESVVLVLDNIDWLIDQLHRPESSFDAERDAAREFLTALVDLAGRARLHTLLTCVRGYVLRQRQLLGWHNPAASIIDCLRVPSLDARSVARMLTALGAQMNVQFDDRALTEVHRQTAGHVESVRRLCSHIVQTHRRRADYHALQAIHIDRREVLEASNDLAEDRATFAEPVLSWLSPCERQVLKYVARQRPRNQDSLKRFLLGTHTADEIALAVDHLRQSGLIVRRSGREEAAMPLLANWVSRNLDHGSGADEQISYQRMRRLALGLGLTTLMFAIYYSWFQLSMGDLAPVEYDGCRYSVRYPQRGVETVTVYLSRQCAATGKRAPIGLQAQSGTIARFGDQWGDLPDAMHCPANHPDCTQARIELELVSASERQYRLALVGGGKPLAEFRIAHDPLSTIKQTLSRGMQLASLLPLLIAALLAFYKDVLSGIRRLFTSVNRRTPDASES